jgi:hypothetical protein
VDVQGADVLCLPRLPDVRGDRCCSGQVPAGPMGACCERGAPAPWAKRVKGRRMRAPRSLVTVSHRVPVIFGEVHGHGMGR